MGPTILALLDAELDAASLVEADAILAGVASKLVRSERGRVWDIWIAAYDGDAKIERPYAVSVERIKNLEEEDLEILVGSNRPLDSVKERLIISSGLNLKADYVQIEALAQRFITRFGGITGAATK
jgi:hypothetical protein